MQSKGCIFTIGEEMKFVLKIAGVFALCTTLSGCLVTSVVGGVVGTAVDVVDAVTPDIVD